MKLPLYVVLILLLQFPLRAQADSFAARADSVRTAFDDHFWQEDTRPTGLGILERLYTRDLAAGRRDSVTAATLSGLGQFHLAIDGEHSRAERFHRSALELGDSLYASPHRMRAVYRLYLGELFIQQNPRESERIIREAIAELKRLPVVDHNNIQGSYWNLSRSFAQAGEFQPARDAIELALADWREFMPDNPHNGGRLYNQLSQVLIDFDQDIPAAVATSKRGLELSHLTRYPINVAYAYSNLGTAYFKAERYELADSIYREMLEYTAANGEMEVLRSAAYVNLSEVARYRGDAELALAYADTAIPLKKQYAPVTLHGALTVRAGALNALGRHADAIAAVNQSILEVVGEESELVDSRRVFAASDAYDFQDLRVALEERITALRATGRERAALADYQLLIDLQTAQRRGGQDAITRRLLSNEYRDYYNEAIALIYALPDRTERDDWYAFKLSEAARGFSLVAELRERQRNRAGLEERLRQSIAVYERIRQPTAGERRILAGNRNNLNKLVAEQRPEQPAAEEEFQLENFLRANRSTVVEYLATTEDYYVFIHHPYQGLLFDRVGSRGELDGLANRWRTAMAAAAYRGKSIRPVAEQQRLDDAMLEAGTALEERLMRRLRSRPGEKVIIVADGELHFLPFGALPLEGGPDWAGYWGDQLTLRFAYSLRHLSEMAAFPAPDNDGSLLVMAPSFGGEAGPLNAVRGGGRAGLKPLSHNHAEATTIGRLLENTTVLTDTLATKQSFLRLAESARVVHLSTHGAVDPLNPNLSFIAFTQKGDTLEEEQLLYFNDLPLLSLAADLVTLSACETNLGEVVPGESVLSMGGAFAAAGSRSTLSTLWQIDDEATTELMRRFYGEIADGTDRAVALQRAQRALREETDYGHPYYWAGFTLHGADGPIQTEAVSPDYLLFGGIVLAGLGFGLLLGLRRLRQ